MARQKEDAPVSRRDLLQGAALLTGFAATIAVSANQAAAAAKLSHAAAKYQDTPKNGQACSTCVYFEPPAACKLVISPVSPMGWCELYKVRG